MTGQVMRKITPEFRDEAVRLVLSSGGSVIQVAGDLGIGKSTLGKWVARYREGELLSGPHDDVQTLMHSFRVARQTGSLL